MYNVTVPFVNVAPIEGLTLTQPFPWNAYEQRISQPDAELIITWTLTVKGNVLGQWSKAIRFRDWKCQNPEEASVSIPAMISAQEWVEACGGGFLETTVAGVDGATMRSMIPEVFYSVFHGPDRRPIYSDGNLKFANRTIIQQIASTGQWCESFPAAYVDPDRDADLSIAAINPYPRDVVITIEALGAKVTRKVKVPRGHCIRIPFGRMLEEAGAQFPYSNTLLVSGPNRVVLFFVFHSRSNPADIIALEHSEPFRAESAAVPLMAVALSKLYKWKKKFIDGANLDRNRLVARAREQVAVGSHWIRDNRRK